MVAGSFSDEFFSPFSPQRMWRANILDAHNHPKFIPGIAYSKVEILQGDGGVGTIKRFTFGEGAIEEFSYLTDRIDIIDHESFAVKFTVLDGGLVGIRLKSYSFEVKFEATNDGGCKTKLEIEYDTLDSSLLTEDEIKSIRESTVAMFKAVENYLQANPDAYI